MIARKTLACIFTVFLFWVSQLGIQGCAHKKKAEPVTLKRLQSKRVALVEIRGESESKKHVEAAILNEILDHGRFEIVDRNSVLDAQVTYPHESDWQRLGQKVGADYVMSVRVLDFSAKDRQGFDKIEEEDSVLTEESGSKEPVIGTRYQKVRAIEGNVKLQIVFFDVAQNAVLHQGMGSAKEVRNSRDKTSFRKMDMLDKLSREAIANFFNELPE
ncbi:MAG: hypothetical protein AB1540_14815 [Bdellovibrionota bacterium]